MKSEKGLWVYCGNTLLLAQGPPEGCATVLALGINLSKESRYEDDCMGL